MTKGCLLAGLALMLSAGCTPSRNGIEPPFPYAGGSYDEQDIQTIAALRCGIDSPSGAALQLNPFTTDGCSMYPDGGWLECCIAHDIDYWCANQRTSRVAADRSLKACVADHSNALNGQLTYLGTRLFGHSALPFSWRWGYGYPWLNIRAATDETLDSDRPEQY